MISLIFMGLLFISICLIVKENLDMGISDKEIYSQAEKILKFNQIAWKVMMSIGIIALILGLIGVLL